MTDTTSLPPDVKPLRLAGFLLEEVEGELLLHHPGLKKTMFCSQTAAMVWHLCDGTRAVRELISLLAAAFPEAPRVTEDVDSTLRTFLEHGAIELRP